MKINDFLNIVKTKYVDFDGRTGKNEFWMYILYYIVIMAIASMLSRMLGMDLINSIAGLALLLPTLAIGARRLHDTGKSAWWLLLIPTIIGMIVLAIFWVKDGDLGVNEYGENPNGINL